MVPTDANGSEVRKLYFPQVRIDATENLFKDEAAGTRAVLPGGPSIAQGREGESSPRHKGWEGVAGVLWEVQFGDFAIGVCSNLREQVTKLTDHAIHGGRLV